jgi:hypothetical protein
MAGRLVIPDSGLVCQIYNPPIKKAGVRLSRSRHGVLLSGGALGWCLAIGYFRKDW